MFEIKMLKNIPKDALIFDGVGLYSSIPFKVRLGTLRDILDQRDNKKISSNNLVEIAAFVLKKTALYFMAKLNTKYKAQPLNQKFHAYICLHFDG